MQKSKKSIYIYFNQLNYQHPIRKPSHEYGRNTDHPKIMLSSWNGIQISRVCVYIWHMYCVRIITNVANLQFLEKNQIEKGLEPSCDVCENRMLVKVEVYVELKQSYLFQLLKKNNYFSATKHFSIKNCHNSWRKLNT